MDAVEKGINVPEDDPKVTSVGYGGLPNEEGVVELDAAIMDGAEQIVVPAFVSLLSICIVFVPMFFLTGVARFLFLPMA